MSGFTGIAWPIKRIIITADAIFDGHMHNNSGTSAPLPLMYAQIADAIGFSFEGSYRRFIEFLVSIQFSDGVDTQKMDAFQIGNHVLGLNAATYLPWTESSAFARNTRPIIISSGEKDNPPKKKLYTPMFTMMMDIERAHIAGYEGKTIYQMIKDRLVYYKRIKPAATYEEGEIVDVSDEMGKNGAWKFQKFKRQYNETHDVAKSNPFNIIPMFFWDPRRWIDNAGEPTKDFDHGPWDFPFKMVASSKNQGLFVGFKMYPPLGHMPLDPQLPLMNNFYSRCQSDKIPILAHCSPGGMTTHEISLFRKYCKTYPLFYSKMNDEFDALLNKILAESGLSGDPSKYTITYEGRDIEYEFFLRYYVDPRAWLPVLSKYPGLRLCLAHFGGDEWKKYEKPWLESDWVRSLIQIMDFRKQPCKSVYTDLSCFNLNDPDERKHLAEFIKLLRNPEYSYLKERIILGTDWYLTLLTGNTGGYYKDYCETFKRFLDDLDGPECDSELWIRFTLLNPFDFYGLGDHQMLQNMNRAFEKELTSASPEIRNNLQSNYERLLSLKNQVNQIKSQLETIK